MSAPLNCQDANIAIGAYLLGALEPDEHAAVEAHVADCPTCRSTVDELAGLPPLLSRLTIDDVAMPLPTPSEDLFDRMAAQARAETGQQRRAHRARRWLAVAAAAVVLAGAGVGAWVATSGGGNGQVAVTAGSVHMAVVASEQANGTAFHVMVSGLPPDEHCRLVAVADDGERELAGAWNATYAGQAQVTGSTTIPRSELASLVLLGNGGTQLAELPL
ncbi:MAG TPA: zf-HC2 domain-containing protein [Mycobacteriales bacterium]|jgi:anti-sigma factor RsiW|nr:zf-HC2 domain-containing protein [Mycobacteriales bacterium]